MAVEAKSGCLIIACGALAREMLAVRAVNGWDDDRLAVTCLPAIWHNRPEKIAGGVQRKIRAGRKKFDRIFVLYGDCGTQGELDRVLAEEGVERIEGPHCYQWFAGTADFEKMMDEEPKEKDNKKLSNMAVRTSAFKKRRGKK